MSRPVLRHASGSRRRVRLRRRSGAGLGGGQRGALEVTHSRHGVRQRRSARAVAGRGHTPPLGGAAGRVGRAVLRRGLHRHVGLGQGHLGAGLHEWSANEALDKPAGSNKGGAGRPAAARAREENRALGQAASIWTRGGTAGRRPGSCCPRSGGTCGRTTRGALDSSGREASVGRRGAVGGARDCQRGAVGEPRISRKGNSSQMDTSDHRCILRRQPTRQPVRCLPACSSTPRSPARSGGTTTERPGNAGCGERAAHGTAGTHTPGRPGCSG